MEDAMRTVGLFYATREGHTRTVIRHISDQLQQQGFDVEVVNVRSRTPIQHFRHYAGVILAASIHQGLHEAEMIAFVKRHRHDLATVPAAFLSISLSEAGVERQSAPPEEHARFTADVEGMLERFYKATNWRPRYVKAVAGALMYTQYNPLIRFIMKRISKGSGGSTDIRRDHIYTDWKSLDHFIAGFTGDIMRVCPGAEVCCRT
jgi:menaquinone-dependent protoporphyrinogen oxidase